MQTESFTLDDLTALLRRRLPMIAAVFGGVMLSVIVFVYSLTDLYYGVGTIIIEQPEVQTKFLPGTYEISDPEQRILRIRDQVMTRDNLVPIVEEFELYVDERDGEPATAGIGYLRQNAVVEVLRDEPDPRSRQLGPVIGFDVGFYHEDPVIAQRVAVRLMNLYLLANQTRRQESYDETTAALAQEADSLREGVLEAEAARAEFKKLHPGALPDDRDYNMRIMEHKARDLDRLNGEIRALEARKTMLQSQLAQTPLYDIGTGATGAAAESMQRLESLRREYIRLLGIYSPDYPDVIRIRREIEALAGAGGTQAMREALEAELLVKRQQLEEMKRLYGQDYPDVRMLERSIGNLDQQLAGLPTDGPQAMEPNNPAYITLDLQLDSTQTELEALRQRRRVLQGEIDTIELRVQIAPEVEREWLALTRDLDIAREQYNDIKARQLAAQTAGVLEGKGVAETYEPKTWPPIPLKPNFPNRPLYIVLGLFAGLTLGIGAGFVSSAVDGTIRGTRDVRYVMQMPPIAAIPVIKTEVDRRRDRHRHFAVATGVLLAVGLVGIYVSLQVKDII